MATKMELVPQPAWGAVALEEIRAVGLSLRWAFIGVAVLLSGLGVFLTGLSLYAEAHGSRAIFPFIPDILTVGTLVALAAPLAVWRSEAPEKRTYLWSLPLSRKGAHLPRLLAGWVWVMVATAIYILWVWAVALLTHGPVWEVKMAARGSFPGYSYGYDWWLLLVPFTSATVFYALGSIFAVTMNYPLRWAAGFWLILFLFLFVDEIAKDRRMEEMQAAGMTAEEIYAAVQQGTLLAKLLTPENPWGMFNVVDPIPRGVESVLPDRGPDVDPLRRVLPVVHGNLAHWLTATALWGGLCLIAAYLAAARFREPEGSP
jgi:hypothetical protein